ncbi:MAG TPA: PIN domain-containing protein [Thermoanaerobaculia bacterium]|nr:PIN domain-containing protein [Thermoanaerobaculia bacterium]
MTILVDTGILYAAADADDAWHERAAGWLVATRTPLLVPVTVLPEVCYLLQTRLGAAAELLFVRSLQQDFLVEAATDSDFERCGELLEIYPAIGFVDASLVAMAERLNIPRVATTDRRHLSMIRPSHVEAFELLP